MARGKLINRMTESEHRVKLDLESKGWTVHRNGWPDFLCWREVETGKIECLCVEVKGRRDNLREGQRTVIKILDSIGLKVAVVRPGHSGLYSGTPFEMVRELESLAAALEGSKCEFYSIAARLHRISRWISTQYLQFKPHD